MWYGPDINIADVGGMNSARLVVRDQDGALSGDREGQHSCIIAPTGEAEQALCVKQVAIRLKTDRLQTAQ